MTVCWQGWFDGSALPNPGRIGIGIVLEAPDGERQVQSVRTPVTGCNNEAELHALCALLRLARDVGAQHLQVRGDSAVAVGYVNGTAHTGIPRLLTLIGEAQALLATFTKVELYWVPQHRNRIADELARAALDLLPRVDIPAKRTKKR